MKVILASLRHADELQDFFLDEAQKLKLMTENFPVVGSQNKVEIDERENGVLAHLKFDLRGRWPRIIWVQCWRLVWADFGVPGVGTEGATKHENSPAWKFAILKTQCSERSLP